MRRIWLWADFNIGAEELVYSMKFMFYLTRSLNKRVPLNSGKETAKKVGVEVGLTYSEIYIAELERKVVRCTAFGVACEEVVCD